MFYTLKILSLIGKRAVSKIKPSIPQEITSPAPTVSMRNGMPSAIPYAYVRTKGTIIVLDMMGGRGDKNFKFLLPVFLKRIPMYQVPRAPIKVAKVPKIISKILLPIMSLRELLQNQKTAG